MFFGFRDKLESHTESSYRNIAIPLVSDSVKERMTQKEWKKVPISETVTEEPKSLEVIPNRQGFNSAMAWPAYYKTVKEGNEGDGMLKGFGELAQTIEGVIQSSPLVKVRPEVKGKLDYAQTLLNLDPDTANLQLVVVDGYRTVEVQAKLFTAYLSFLRKKNQGMDEDTLLNLAQKMVSKPPDDMDVLRKSPPPHTTGGSVDVILVHKDKIDTTSDYWLQEAMVNFGAEFDEMMNPIYHDTRSETSFYETKAAEGKKLNKHDKEALENRRILFNVMKEACFTNYYTEFWHYDFGNQFNAVASNKDSAQFGFAGGITENGVVGNLSAEIKAFNAYAARHGEDEAARVKHHFGL